MKPNNRLSTELELLAMELRNQLAKEKQMKQQKDKADRKEKEDKPGMEDDELVAIMHHFVEAKAAEKAVGSMAAVVC